jgi:hypothetical protein
LRRCVAGSDWKRCQAAFRLFRPRTAHVTTSCPPTVDNPACPVVPSVPITMSLAPGVSSRRLPPLRDSALRCIYGDGRGLESLHSLAEQSSACRAKGSSASSRYAASTGHPAPALTTGRPSAPPRAGKAASTSPRATSPAGTWSTSWRCPPRTSQSPSDTKTAGTSYDASTATATPTGHSTASSAHTPPILIQNRLLLRPAIKQFSRACFETRRLA